MPKVVTTPEWDTLLNTHNLDTVAGVYALNAAPQIIKHGDRKSTRLNSSHRQISYAGFCLKKKQKSGPVRCDPQRDTALSSGKDLRGLARPRAGTSTSWPTARVRDRLGPHHA